MISFVITDIGLLVLSLDELDPIVYDNGSSGWVVLIDARDVVEFHTLEQDYNAPKVSLITRALPRMKEYLPYTYGNI